LIRPPQNHRKQRKAAFGVCSGNFKKSQFCGIDSHTLKGKEEEVKDTNESVFGKKYAEETHRKQNKQEKSFTTVWEERFPPSY